MSAKYWKVGVNEQYRSLVKGVFVKSLQKLVPDVTSKDLAEPGAGVRAQAINKKGTENDSKDKEKTVAKQEEPGLNNE